ncbi:ATP-binding cassette domain-containing protein [Methylobacter luteus]|uniref:ATP-binding cassette domain-containing protein n=1 Tax=Methylobacter luteus TaxID=415 RepID=UPI0004105EE4|nr:ATP-binding cassette domain-containing protein [Methylobacter luteus]
MNNKKGGALKECIALLKTVHTPHLKLRLSVALVLLVTGPVASVLAPVVLGDAVNLLSAEQTSATASMFFWGAVLYVVLAAFSSSASNLRDLVVDPVIEDLKCRFSVTSFAHLFQLSHEFHSNHRSGSVLRIVERGVQSLEELIRSTAFSLAPTAIEFTLGLVVLVYKLDWQFAAVASVGVILYMAVNRWADERRISSRRAQNELDSKVAGLALDGLTNFTTVTLLGAEDAVMSRHERAAQRYAVAAARSAGILNVITILQHSVMRICLTIIVVMAGFGVLDGKYEVGDVLTSILLIRGLFYPLGMLGYHYRSMQQATIDLEKALEIRRTPPAFQQIKTGLIKQNEISSPPSIELKGATYSYAGRAAPVVENLSMCFRQGKRTAIVGPSGGGKSSILNLTARLFDPVEGQVLLNGENLAEMDPATLRNIIAVVPQDVSLFNDTLEMNLTLGSIELTQEEIYRVLAATELSELVEKLPNGLQTLVGERGVMLSGGERQRVGIARAMLRNPKVLIMDEATSSLDGATEFAIQRTLKKVSKGLTSIIVAHRLSTVVDADYIYVVKDGKVIQSGTHQDLCSESGYYQSAWERQIAVDSV